MPDVVFQHIVSCSSEDPAFPGKNLLHGNRKWRTVKDGDSTASVILQLQRETRISKVDVGNNGSAFVEVLVGKSSAPEKEFEVLLLTSSFMTPAESRAGTDTTRVRMFDQDKLCKETAKLKWDRVKVVCHQKFNPRAQFGLSFVQLQAPAEESAGPSSTLGRFMLRDEPEEDFVPGSLFARRNQPPSDPPSAQKPSTAAAIAGAASTPNALAGHTKAAVIIPKKRDTPTPVAKRKIIQSPASTSKSPVRKPFGKFRRTLDSDTEEEEVPDEDESYKVDSDTEFESDGPQSDGVEESPLGHKKAPKRRRTNNKEKKPEPTPKIRRAAQRVPFKQLLQGVTIVLSGFQNPIRGILRDKATDLGAKYKTDWDQGCTHLISAFANTPKVRQVKSMGGGRIVTKEWLEQCFRKRTRFPWRRFALDKAEQEHSESEEEILEQAPGTSNGSTNVAVADVDSEPDIVIADESDIIIADEEDDAPVVKQSSAVALSPEYDADTDYESDSASTAQWPKLPDFFDGLVFALHEQLPAAVRQKLRRYIVSAKGLVEDNLSENCKFLVAENSDDLSELQEFCPDVKSVRPEWVWQCMDGKRLQPL